MKTPLTKRKSVVVLILIAFWLTYTAVTVFFFFHNNREFHGALIERRKGLIDFHLDNSAHFLLEDKPESLAPRLEKARQLHEFDFYLLRKGDEVVSFYNKDGHLEGINHDYKILNEFQQTADFVIKTIPILDYKLTLGIRVNEMAMMWEDLKHRHWAILQDLAVVTFLVFLIVYLILRDILQISKILQSANRSDLTSVRSMSREAETLVQAATGFEQVSGGLKRDNLLLASSLGPAIREELHSGQTPPYAFPCTLVRVDLNGYTQLVLQKEPKELIHLLSEYFRLSRDLIERYDGLIYQYVGDEIIFFFKERDSYSPQRRALACIRGLFEMAESLKIRELPNGLRLKASYVSGVLQFVKMDQGHSFNGLPLIESVRMLGQVSEKNESSLIVYAESESEISSLCHPSEVRTAVFKGFQSQSHLLEIKSFIGLPEAFAKLPLKEVGEYFRSDSDLVVIIEKLVEFIRAGEPDSFFALISPLLSMSRCECNATVMRSSDYLLRICFENGFEKLNESRILASVVSLSQNLLQGGSINSDIIRRLNECEEAQDPRVRANALIAKTCLDLEVTELKSKMNSTNNRLAADAVWVAGLKDFNAGLAAKVNEFIRSSQPKFVASGLYLIANIYDYYRKKDLVYLKANPFLRSLAAEIPQFLDHPNALVRARAMRSWEIIQRGGPLED